MTFMQRYCISIPMNIADIDIYVNFTEVKIRSDTGLVLDKH